MNTNKLRQVAAIALAQKGHQKQASQQKLAAMPKEKRMQIAGIALAQRIHKNASIQEQGADSRDKCLEMNEDKINDGGSPAAATAATNASNAQTFDVKPNNKQPASREEGGNTVGDNEDMTPRNKTASLNEVLLKQASAGLAEAGDPGLEAESDKQVGEGGVGEDNNGAESDKNPEVVSTKSSDGTSAGDENSDSVARKGTSKEAADMSAILKNLAQL